MAPRKKAPMEYMSVEQAEEELRKEGIDPEDIMGSALVGMMTGKVRSLNQKRRSTTTLPAELLLEVRAVAALRKKAISTSIGGFQEDLDTASENDILRAAVRIGLKVLRNQYSGALVKPDPVKDKA